MRVVLIGGPLDGRRIGVEDEPPEILCFSLPMLTDDNTITHPDTEMVEYRKIAFLAGVIVYAHSDVSEHEVLLKLIQGYNPNASDIRGRHER